MSIYYTKEANTDAILYCWHEDYNYLDIWYDRVISIAPSCEDIPAPLAEFVERWKENIREYMKSYRERSPVKMAKIEFIYEDEVYAILPTTIGAVYESTFMSDTPYTVSWDSLLEEYQSQIREDFARTLGVTHSRYSGYLD